MHTADGVAREVGHLLLRDVVPQHAGEVFKAWLHRVAVATGLKPGYVKRLRYHEVPVVPAHVADLMRELAARERAMRQKIAAAKEQNAANLAACRAGVHLDERDVDEPSAIHEPTSDCGDDPRQMWLALIGGMHR